MILSVTNASRRIEGNYSNFGQVDFKYFLIFKQYLQKENNSYGTKACIMRKTPGENTVNSFLFTHEQQYSIVLRE